MATQNMDDKFYSFLTNLIANLFPDLLEPSSLDLAYGMSKYMQYDWPILNNMAPIEASVDLAISAVL